MNEPTMHERLNAARNAGYFAYFARKQKSNNPYSKIFNAPEHESWNEGWDTAETTFGVETEQSLRMNAESRNEQ